ncbi:aminotransferase class IV [Candidatus Sumerlaeota bacterium]|nr:aminotransferase class IV [Candidatus Sumerlaeota bacterium]
MTQQILNNALTELNPDALPFGDPAVQWGAAGFFESLRVVARSVHLFDAHLRRLARSLELWKIEWPVDRAILLEAIRRELNRFAPDAVLRLRITVGPAPDAPMTAEGKWPPRVFVAASPMLAEYLAPSRERTPWNATIFRDYHVSSMHPLSGHKSAQYTLYWEARRRARARGFDEAIVSMGRHFAFSTNPKTPYAEGAYLADFLTDRATDFRNFSAIGSGSGGSKSNPSARPLKH